MESDTRARRHALAVGLAVFVSGGVLLGVEIAASRVIAPYFGNSLFVWGALIGVVLTGLSLGYWLGGALGDRLPAPRLLVGVIGLAALLVLAIPLVDEPVLDALVAWNPGPRLNPLLAAVALFGAPSVVMAMVTPIAVRLLAQSVSTVGRTAGRLFAVSTAGSIVGTFATAFFLVPELGTDQLLAVAAAVLFAGAALTAAVERLPVAGAVVLAGAAVSAVLAVTVTAREAETLSASQVRNWSPVYRLRGDDAGTDYDVSAGGMKVVLRKDTAYHRLAVVEDETTRYLRFDASFQSGMILGRPFATAFPYTDFFHLAWAYNPGVRSVLHIGLGGGSSVKRMWRDFPELSIQVAEIDPDVVEVAYQHFALPRDARLRVTVEDGRRFLRASDERWDAIVIDAFYADAVPFHLTTREFVELARSRLAPGGVLLANVIGAVEGEGSKFFRALYRTYSTSFPTVLVHPVLGLEDDPLDSTLNLILVATESAAPPRPVLQRRWRELRAEREGLPDLSKAIRDRYDRRVDTRDVPTLTDDYAPTDALLLFG